MRKIERLKKEALSACQWRGHIMPRFKCAAHQPTVAFSNCRVCDMQVVVDTKPAPNGIDIGGEAVALNCAIPNKEPQNATV